MTGSKVFYSLAEAAGQFGPCSIAIGNFDGVHVGHQALIRATVDHAAAHGFVPAILTFDPHPATVVAPDRKVEFVSKLEDRLRLLAEAGIRHILVLPFTEEVSRLSPEEFVREILLKPLETRAVFVGENFRFGYRQAGNPDTLRQLGTELGFVPHFLPPVRVRGEIVSSSAIRRHISDGRVARAARLLGRCFSVSGPVMAGQGIGSRQTVPTLNLDPVPGQVLPRGVFITGTVDRESGRSWPSITNAGVKPTFGKNETVIETYLLTPLGDTSPANIEVQFRRFVRQERQFPSPEALRVQILRDAGRAKSYWRRLSKFLHVDVSIEY